MARISAHGTSWIFGVTAALIGGLTVALTPSRVVLAVVVAGCAGAGVTRARSIRTQGRTLANATAAHLSHELRTPLTSVLGIMDVLGDTSVPLAGDERAELLGLAHSEALHMNHVVSNLVASSRIARDVLEPKQQPVDLVALVTHALHRIPSVEKRTYIDTHGATAALADPALTLQIVLNLIQNVERYAPTGGVEIEFETSGSSVTMTISDEGPGIDPVTAFRGGSSDQGLGLGLPLSRRLARLMDGDLKAVRSRRGGATLALELTSTNEIPEVVPALSTPDRERILALSPRARVIVDMAEALAERSIDRVVAGLQHLCSELVGSDALMLFVPDQTGGFSRASTFGNRAMAGQPEPEPLQAAMDSEHPLEFESLQRAGHPGLSDELGCDAALLVRVVHGGEPVAVLTMGWSSAADLPGEQGRAVVEATAELTAFAIDRSSLSRDAAFERELRGSVMESLPIAISVFAGDPPQVIDWNARERQLLGLDDDVQRPSDLDASQGLFDVRFADGTPLTVDNAPVTQAIRSGETTGPFLIRIRRIDGTETITRTHCAPFTDADGRPIGAVVTSEELDIAPHELDITPIDGDERRSA